MTAKSEFKKWFSACRACVRDQRNAGADGMFFADYHGVRFSSGALSTGLERADLYKNHNVKRYDNVIWQDCLNDLMAKPARDFGKGWYRATLVEMRKIRLHTYN